jgi:signal transduction histidine kinase
MTLVHCMDRDWFWIVITVTLAIAVAIGYGVIALHWWRNQRSLSEGPPKAALRSIGALFILCGITGYAFIPIKLVWPGWRLYDMVMFLLACVTWRYVWRARELRVIYSAIERSQQLASDLEASRAESQHKSAFLNAISHDLRTPLNGLSLQTDLAEMNLQDNDPDSLRRSLAGIKSAANAAAQLLDRFLELAQIDWNQEPNKFADFDLTACIQQVADTHKTAAQQKGLYLHVDGPTPLLICSDRLKIERVASNLISNGVKFTNTGGVSVHIQPSNPNVTVDFTDTGVGIAPQHQESVFEEFFQVQNIARDRTKGFGLGLAIARRLARQLGGDLVYCNDQPMRGSCFRLVLRNVIASPSAQTATQDDAFTVS